MLNLLWDLIDDDSEKESQALAGLVKQHPELPDWSAAVQPLLDRLLTSNPIVAFGVKKLLTLGCSRENEFEADRDAATFCHRAGYSARAGVDFLERLARGELPSGVIQQLVSTHPPLSERLTELRGSIERLPTAAPE
jgi:Zn-dependent protease with chaperone function